MKATKKLIALLLVMLALTACKDDGEVVYMLPEKKPIQLSAEQKQMRDNNNEFAWRLFQTMQEQKGEVSTVLSPISVTYMLGIIPAVFFEHQLLIFSKVLLLVKSKSST